MASSQTDRLSVAAPIRVWTGPGSTCTLTTADSGVEIAGYVASVDVVLPASGGAYTIIDGGDQAQTYPITVKTSAGTTLGTIGTDGGSVTFAWNGTEFRQINALVNGAFGSGWAIDNAGNFTMADLLVNGVYATGSIAAVVPTAGQSLTIPAVAWYLMVPAGTLATLTLTLPADGVNGQDLWITAAHQITALTLNAGAGQTLDTTVTALDAGESVMLRLLNAVWFVMKGHGSGGGGAGTVTSIDASGGTTGLSFSGGPVTTSGTVTLSGTLVAANGGTGFASYTAGDMLYASGSTALSKLAAGSNSQVLIGGTTPAWGAVALGSMVSGTLPAANGGTGVNNGSSTITLGGALTFSGSFTAAFTVTGNTSVTLPTSGTLATTANINTALPSITTGQFYGGTGGAGVAQAMPQASMSAGALTLGTSTSTIGQLKLAGNTSGTATITPQAAAGTPTLTLPNASGTFAVSVATPLSLSATTGAISWAGTSGGVLYFDSSSSAASSAALTSNALVLGGGAGGAPKTAVGFTTDGTSQLTLGVAGTSTGALKVTGSTSGTVTVTAQATAGTVTFTLPNASGTPAISVPSPLSLSATSGAVTWSGLTSGGVLYASSTTAVGTSNLLTANALILGGGAGAAPTPMGSLGTTTTVLHGNAAGAPTFGAVSLTADVSGTLPVANGGTGITNTPYVDLVVTISGGGLVPSTGIKQFVQCNSAYSVVAWTVLNTTAAGAAQSDTVAIDITKDAYASFGTNTSMVGAGTKPSTSAATKNTAAPASWTSTTIAAGDVLGFNLTTAPGTATIVYLILKLQRT